MLYFVPKPDFIKLSKYYKFQTPPEVLQQQYEDGYHIVINWYYTDEMVDDVTKRFTEIIHKYNLTEHLDNLMFLTLQKVQEFENVVTAAIDENNMMFRAKELAGLLLAYQDEELSKTPKLLVKTLKETYNVNDLSLSQWIGSLISKALKEGNVPLQLMNMATDYLFIDTVDGKRVINKSKVEEVYNRKLKKTSTYISQYQTRLKAEFCYYILPYLNGETTLVKPDGKNFSDEQLNFLYDVMLLLEIIKPGSFDETMDYEPKDSIRNLLMKYAKALGIKGNR